jgi:hypothetical protein
MSSKTVAATDGTIDIAFETNRRAALRLAVGVTLCFAVVELLKLDATFLAPLLAASMLAKPGRPPALAQGFMVMVLIALTTGIVLLVTAALISNPAVLILALTLILYLSFYAHRRGAPDLATLLLQISAVALPTIAVASPEGAAGFAAALLTAGGVALLTVWAAHGIFPVPAGATADAAAAGTAPPPLPEIAARNAFLDTLVLFPVLAWYILDARQVAVVLLIIIVTLLRQNEVSKGQHTALGLILGNLLGGIAAAIVYNLVQMNHTFLFFICACLAMSLVFAGRLVTAGERAPVYAIAFSTFILLLGLGLTPLPGGSEEAFADRLFYVLLASAYAVGTLSLTQRWRLK